MTITPTHEGCRPTGMATSTRITACAPMVTTLLSVRPSSRDTRGAGVTRCRSRTPSRTSWMMPNPAKPAPKMASCSNSPGTNSDHDAEPPRPPARTLVSSGPNNTR